METETGVEAPYGEIPKSTAEKLAVLKQLVSTYYGVQKVRVGMGNRIAGIVKEYGETEYTNRLVDVFETSEEIEKSIMKHVRPILKEFPIYSMWLRHVKGIGDVLAAGLISGIKTPARFENISKLWKYCGYHVENGRAPRRTAGSKVSWSPFMKTLCWKVGESFVKTKGYYRLAYETFRKDEERKSEEGMVKPIDDAVGFIAKDEEVINVISKSKQTESEPAFLTKSKVDMLKKKGITEIRVGMTKSHVFARAKRKTVKLFLAHLWQVWREIEDLPVTEPYAHTLLGHADLIEPPRF